MVTVNDFSVFPNKNTNPNQYDKKWIFNNKYKGHEIFPQILKIISHFSFKFMVKENSIKNYITEYQ